MRRVVGVLVVIALVATACGGGSKKAAVKGAGGQAAADPSSTSSSAPAAAGSSSTTVPAVHNATGTGKGATAPAGSAGTTTTTAKRGATASSQGVQPAAPGGYTYDRTGTTHSSLYGDQSADGKVTLKVDPVSNGRQHSAQTASDSTSDQTLEFLAEGAYFTDIKQSMGGYTKEFTPNPPVLALPADAAVGRTWSWTVTSTDGRTTVTSNFKVERNETVAVGGESVPTIVLSIVLKGTGDITLNSTSTDWVSPSKGLIVRSDQTSDGSLSGISFHSQTSMIMESTRPS